MGLKQILAEEGLIRTAGQRTYVISKKSILPQSQREVDELTRKLRELVKKLWSWDDDVQLKEGPEIFGEPHATDFWTLVTPWTVSLKSLGDFDRAGFRIRRLR